MPHWWSGLISHPLPVTTMTERQNLFAYTEIVSSKSDYVGYLSLNREPDGQITLTVREPGDGTKHATITLPPETLEHMAAEIMAKLNG